MLELGSANGSASVIKLRNFDCAHYLSRKDINMCTYTRGIPWYRTPGIFVPPKKFCLEVILTLVFDCLRGEELII